MLIKGSLARLNSLFLHRRDGVLNDFLETDRHSDPIIYFLDQGGRCEVPLTRVLLVDLKELFEGGFRQPRILHEHLPLVEVRLELTFMKLLFLQDVYDAHRVTHCLGLSLGLIGLC